MRCVELFAGAGGLALGMARGGFRHEAVIERDHDSCETIRANQRRGVEPVRTWPLFESDVCTFDYSSLAERIDLVAGGPPCQPFSLGGKHQGREDIRDMFPEAVRAVRELRPRAFVFENVKGLLRHTFTRYFQHILLQLEFPECPQRLGESWEDHQKRLQKVKTEGRYDGLKYNVVADLLNACEFGVPQRRERVFIVGFRADVGVKWSFPQPTHSRESLLREMWVTGEYWERHEVPRRARPRVPERLLPSVEVLKSSIDCLCLKPWQTVRDAIRGLPDPTSAKGKSIPNHVFNPGARPYAGHTGSFIDEPAKTLKAGDHGVPGGENMLAMPDGSVRYFTVRESARLQTFPDDYVFQTSWTESMRQIGNAVPVTLAEVVGASVHKCLQQSENPESTLREPKTRPYRVQRRGLRPSARKTPRVSSR
ncbi:MAG: DNA cytosine methyltransferase [Verrucomicrobiia bacterium]